MCTVLFDNPHNPIQVWSVGKWNGETVWPVGTFKVTTYKAKAIIDKGGQQVPQVIVKK